MQVAFEKLPSTAKIWIFPSSRKFYKEELEELEGYLSNFIDMWRHDGYEIISAFKIRFNRFIIVGIDDTIDPIRTEIIDSLMTKVFALQTKYRVELIDKLNVCFKQGDYVQYKELKEFKKLIKNKSISSKTLVYNNLIHTKAELQSDWEIPLEESWYNRFL